MAKITVKYGLPQKTKDYTNTATLETAGKLMETDLLITTDIGEDIEASKTTSASTSTVTVTPSSGYTGIAEVKVKPITVTGATAANIKADQTVTVVSGDNTITNVTGTFTSDATAKAGEILESKTAYVNGAKITGTIQTKSATNVTTSDPVITDPTDPEHGKEVTLEVTVDAGYYGTTVSKEFTYDLGQIIPDIDPDAANDNILYGKKAYDEDGNVLTGTMPNNGAVNHTISSQGGTYTVPEGYHNGTGVVTANINDATTSVAGSASGTVSTLTFATNTLGTFTASGSASLTGTATLTVSTPGYISGNKTGSVTGNATVNATVNKVGVGVNASTTTLALNPSITRTEKPSADTWKDGADGAGVTTKPTSGVYVQVNRAAASDSATAEGKVSTAGYGDTTHFTADAATTISASVAAATLYVPIKTTSIGAPTTTSTKSGPEGVTGTATTVTVPTGATIVRYTITANSSYTQTQEGYVMVDAAAHTGNTSTQTVDIPVFQLS